MTQIQGIDMSFDRLDDDEAARLRANGVEVFWQCLWTGAQAPAVRVENLRTAQRHGFILLGYISVAPHHDGQWHFDRGRAGIPDDLWEELVLVPTDVELAGIPHQMIRDCVEATFRAGKRRSLYTSYGHWTGQQGNTTQFKDCLLFNALWDGDPDVDFPRLPYGGWTPDQVVCEQYTGGGDVFGAFADRDTFNEELLMADYYTKAETNAIVAELLGALASHGFLITALGGGLAAVAQTVGRIQGVSGDSSTTLRGILDEMNTRVEDVEKKVKKHEDAAQAAAAVIVNG